MVMPEMLFIAAWSSPTCRGWRWCRRPTLGSAGGGRADGAGYSGLARRDGQLPDLDVVEVQLVLASGSVVPKRRSRTVSRSDRGWSACSAPRFGLLALIATFCTLTLAMVVSDDRLLLIFGHDRRAFLARVTERIAPVTTVMVIPRGSTP